MTEPALLLRTEDGHELSLLAWRFDRPVLAASTASCGGGVGLRSWVVNAQVGHGYARTDLAAHAAELAALAGLRGTGVTMLTAVDVRDVRRLEVEGVRVAATVGVTVPTWAAADEPAADAVPAGTINVVAELPVRVEAGGLVNLVATITEAKCQALAEAGVPGTGTASDAVTVVCPASGAPWTPFGGPRSVWGSRAARGVHRAILSALTGRP